MKKIALFSMIVVLLVLVISPTVVFGKKAKLPKELLGTWQSEDAKVVLVLDKKKGVHLKDERSGVVQEYKSATLFLIIEDMGYLAFPLEEAVSDGTDATQMYKDMGPQYYIAFQAIIEEDGSLAVHLAGMGRGLTDEANLKSTDNIVKKDRWLQTLKLQKK